MAAETARHALGRRLTVWLAAGALLCALPAAAGAALSPNAQTALDSGLHHLYSLEYAQARADFRRLIEQEPDNPFGYLFESGAVWWESSQEYGLFKDTPTLQGLFEEDVDMAVKKADALTGLRNSEARVDGHFVEGMALGTRGQWALMRGHYLKAFFDAKRAIKHLRKVPKIDPDYRDVDLGLGVYDYEMAHLSGVARISGLLGVRGDEARGLEELRTAMDQGKHSSLQAAVFLSSIYILDKRDWGSALAVLDKLRAAVPESVYFDSLAALAHWKLGQKDESLAIGREIFQKAKGDPLDWNRKLLSLTCGLMADQCLARPQAAVLRDWLSAAIAAEPEPRPRPKPRGRQLKLRAAKAPPAATGAAAPDGEEAYLTLLHLYRGYMAEALGRPEDAAADYAWALKHEDFGDAHERARFCAEAGCPANEVLLYLRGASRVPDVPAVPVGGGAP